MIWGDETLWHHHPNCVTCQDPMYAGHQQQENQIRWRRHHTVSSETRDNECFYSENRSFLLLLDNQTFSISKVNTATSLPNRTHPFFRFCSAHASNFTLYMSHQSKMYEWLIKEHNPVSTITQLYVVVMIFPE